MNNLPILYATRHPRTGHWFVDESREFVAGLAAHEGAEVATLDVPGLLRVMKAAEAVYRERSGDALDRYAAYRALGAALAALAEEPTP